MLYFAASFTTFAICIVCYFLWPRFSPLTHDEQKIFDSFNIALQNDAQASVEYTTWDNKAGEYKVSILGAKIVVSHRLGRILEEIHSKHWDERLKAERSADAEAIYSAVMKKYPDATSRIENGSFKGSTTPLSPRPPVPGYPASTQKD